LLLSLLQAACLFRTRGSGLAQGADTVIIRKSFEWLHDKGGDGSTCGIIRIQDGKGGE